MLALDSCGVNGGAWASTNLLVLPPSPFPKMWEAEVGEGPPPAEDEAAPPPKTIVRPGEGALPGGRAVFA